VRQPYSPRMPAFSLLPARDRAILQGLGTRTTHRAHTEIYRQEDPSTHLYRVLEGRINLVAASTEGRELIVRVLYPGDLLGLSAVIAKVPYEASAVVTLPSVLQTIRAEVFMNFIQQSSGAIACVARALSVEYLDIVERAQILQLTSTTPARVARVLLECAHTDDVLRPFPFLFTHAEVANMVGCTRESVSRTIGSFKDNRYIKFEDHTVTIMLPNRLTEVGQI
jgi:CRP/FNR family cyclic AMP-dependent transcriptional regulator